MKYSIDLNIFLYAADSDSRFYESSKLFLESCIAEKNDCYLTWDTIYGFIRISTHSGIFENPLTPKTALENITNVVHSLEATLIGSDITSWEIFTKLNRKLAIKGKLVPDAILASILEANGISRLYTHDRDLWKFASLKPVDPI